MPLASLDPACAETLARWGVPGAVVGVLAEGEIEVAAHGVADLGTGAPVRADTSFRVASITKPFTATLALLLADEGRLSLDDAAPGLPAPRVTLAQALAHAGGVESELGDLSRFGDGDDALGSTVSGLGALRRLVGPGEAFSYANSGYWSVGHACARAAGTTYEDALRARVLEPLGLAATGFGEPEARGHVQPEPGRQRHEPLDDRSYPRARRPSGGLVSTAGDLLRFAAFHLGEPRLAELRRASTTTATGSYGLGWAHEAVGGADLWFHLGTFGGFQSVLALLPAQDAAFVVLANGDAGDAVRRELTDHLLDELAGARRDPVPTLPVASEELELLAGRYASGQLDATVTVDADGLLVDGAALDYAGGRTPLPRLAARPVAPRTFAVVGGQWDGDRFDFVPAAGPPRFLRFAALVPRC
jgi:CubicO group peptidase (beta-lactamase class C family)